MMVVNAHLSYNIGSHHGAICDDSSHNCNDAESQNSGNYYIGEASDVPHADLCYLLCWIRNHIFCDGRRGIFRDGNVDHIRRYNAYYHWKVAVLYPPYLHLVA
jgi:hypothetical protein